MKKKFLFIFLAFAIALAGCGGSDDSKDDNGVEVTYVELPDVQTLYFRDTADGIASMNIEPDYDERTLKVDYKVQGGSMDIDTFATVGDSYFDTFEKVETIMGSNDQRNDNAMTLVVSADYVDESYFEVEVGEYFSDADIEVVKGFYDDLVALFQEDQY